MNRLLGLLDYSEYVIPLIFFFFAHIVDTKVHKVWEGVSYHPNAKIRIIHHYQWEACFLIISLLAILGVKMAHHSHLFYAGLWLFGVSFSLMFCLFLLALDIMNRNKIKMSALPLYLSIVVYLYYITTDLYFLKLNEPKLIIIGKLVFDGRYLFLFTGLICLVVLFFLKRWIDWKLYTPDLDADNVRINKAVYKSKYSTRIKKAEALFYILKHYSDNNQPEMMKKWRQRAAKDIPKEMKVVVKSLEEQ